MDVFGKQCVDCVLLLMRRIPLFSSLRVDATVNTQCADRERMAGLSLPAVLRHIAHQTKCFDSHMWIG